MRSKANLYLRDRKTDRIETVPLYTKKEDAGSSYIAVKTKDSGIVYAKVVGTDDAYTSMLRVRKKDKTIAGVAKKDKAGSPDVLDLDRFHHIVFYDADKHDWYEQKADELEKEYKDETDTHKKIQIYMDRGRYRHLADISDYADTIYHRQHDTLPNVLDMSNLDDTCYMFYGAKELKMVDELDMHGVDDMRNMFELCQSLPAIFPWVVDGAEIHSIERLRDMYKDSSVSKVYFKNLKTSVAKDVEEHPEVLGLAKAVPCVPVNATKYKMMELYPDTYATTKKFDTEAPFCVLGMTSIFGMFEDCAAMEDVEEFDTSWIRDFEYAYKGCKALPAKFPFPIDISTVTSATNLRNMFQNSSVKRVTFITPSVDVFNSITDEILGQPGIDIRMLMNLTNEHHRMSEIVTGYDMMKKLAVETHLETGFNDASYMYEGCAALEQMDDDAVLASKEIANMSSMFRGCSSLEEMPNLHMESCRDASAMYRECSSLTDVPYFDASNIKTMTYMFYGCFKLPKVFSQMLDVRRVGFAKDFYQMLGKTLVEALSLVNVDMTVRKSLAKEDIGENLKTLNYYATVDWILGDVDTRRVPLQDAILFRDDTHKLSELPETQTVNKLIYEKMERIGSTVGGSRLLETVGEIVGTETAKSAAGLFDGCIKLKNVPSYSLAGCYDTSRMFAGCTSLVVPPALDLSHVNCMKEMFEDCSALPEEFPWEVDLSSVTDAENLRDFISGTNVKSIRFKNVDASIKPSIDNDLIGGTDVSITITTR